MGGRLAPAGGPQVAARVALRAPLAVAAVVGGGVRGESGPGESVNSKGGFRSALSDPRAILGKRRLWKSPGARLEVALHSGCRHPLTPLGGAPGAPWAPPGGTAGQAAPRPPTPMDEPGANRLTFGMIVARLKKWRVSGSAPR